VPYSAFFFSPWETWNYPCWYCTGYFFPESRGWFLLYGCKF